MKVDLAKLMKEALGQINKIASDKTEKYPSLRGYQDPEYFDQNVAPTLKGKKDLFGQDDDLVRDMGFSDYEADKIKESKDIYALIEIDYEGLHLVRGSTIEEIKEEASNYSGDIKAIFHADIIAGSFFGVAGMPTK